MNTKSMSVLLNLPISDNQFPYRTTRVTSSIIVLDEANNQGLKSYFDMNRLCYYTASDTENQDGVLCVFIEYDDYLELTNRFSGIKALCIAPNILISLASKNTKEFYNNLSCGSRRVYAEVHQEHMRKEILCLFEYSCVICGCYGLYRGGRILYYIHLPDFMTYQKFVLLQGGSDKFILFESIVLQ